MVKGVEEGAVKEEEGEEEEVMHQIKGQFRQLRRKEERNCAGIIAKVLVLKQPRSVLSTILIAPSLVASLCPPVVVFSDIRGLHQAKAMTFHQLRRQDGRNCAEIIAKVLVLKQPRSVLSTILIAPSLAASLCPPVAVFSDIPGLHQAKAITFHQLRRQDGRNCAEIIAKVLVLKQPRSVLSTILIAPSLAASLCPPVAVFSDIPGLHQAKAMTFHQLRR